MQIVALMCGIAGIISSFLAIIILFLVRKNILDIVDKEVIIFEGNFAIKKEAIIAAMNLVDHISTKGKHITSNPEYAQRAKQTYNDLLCVSSSEQVPEEFFDIAINQDSMVDHVRIENFKILCRKDIGFKTKLKKVSNANNPSMNFQSQQFNTPTPQPTTQQKRTSK